MIPFLFPILLLLYGEFSEDLETRYTARMFLYGYLGTVVSPLYIDDQDTSLLISGFLMLCALGNILLTSSVARIKPFIVLLAGLHLMNYTSLYTGEYAAILSVEWYANYSHLILRELTIITVGLCTTSFSKDGWLNLLTAMLYSIEYSLLL